METPQQYDVMNELMKVFVEALRKQAFSVLLLLGCCGALTYALRETRKECREHTVAYNASMAALSREIKVCTEAREALGVEVAALKVRLDLLQLPSSFRRK